MKLNWKLPWLPQKHQHLMVKFAVFVLLTGLAFRLVLVRSSGLSSTVETPFPGETTAVSKPMLSDEQAPQSDEDQISVNGKIDLQNLLLLSYQSDSLQDLSSFHGYVFHGSDGIFMLYVIG